MRLTDLEAYFIRYWARPGSWQSVVGDPATWQERGRPTETVHGMQQGTRTVDTLAEAQGLWMLCPACFVKNGGSVGTHWVDVTFADRGVPPELGCHGRNGAPTRWRVSGTGLEDLTTHPSILLEGGCGWHGFIENGGIRSV